VKKLFMVATISIAISGCSDSSKELTFSAMPKELSDCRVFEVTNSNNKYITVVRCPSSVTTTNAPSGKQKRTTVVIDGVEYTKAEK